MLHPLGSNRAPDNYVAGATPLNQHAKRYSSDIDVFHDRENAIALSVQNDANSQGGGGLQYPVDSARANDLHSRGHKRVTIHHSILPLGALIWAAVEKAPGFTPEGLIAEIRRNSNYPASEWGALASTEPLDPKSA